jgi:hypothetical protein
MTAPARFAAPPCVMLDLPRLAGRTALRAALMAMRVPPLTLPTDAEQRRQALGALVKQPSAVAFIDISHAPGSAANGLVDLFTQVPAGPARQRVMLTRLADGHVSEADRAWMRELGFADLLPELDPLDGEGLLRQALDWAARHMALPSLSPSELARFVRAAVTSGESGGPRELIRRRTGLAAEALVERLAGLLDVQDRRWHFTTYPRCFVGSEAVARIASAWRCSRAEAVELGQALGQLGLLVHVVQEHPFRDENLFYRLAWPETPLPVGLGELWETLSLPGGVESTTRRYLGRAYPDCWVGRQAVDHLCKRHPIDRLQAWLAMHRLMQYGLFEHVVRERPFIDGEFFYRFASLEVEEAA